jgi:hypothetical protein
MNSGASDEKRIPLYPPLFEGAVEGHGKEWSEYSGFSSAHHILVVAMLGRGWPCLVLRVILFGGLQRKPRFKDKVV